MKKLISFSKKSYNFYPVYSILAILGQVIGKTETNLYETDFFKFWYFPDFWGPKIQIFSIFQKFGPESCGKSGNLKKSKIGLQIFCFFFAYNLAKMTKDVKKLEFCLTFEKPIRDHVSQQGSVSTEAFRIS